MFSAQTLMKWFRMNSSMIIQSVVASGRDPGLLVLTHNVMILVVLKMFSTVPLRPIFYDLQLMDAISLVHTLTFDVFGTILDLGGSHAPRLREFVKSIGTEVTADELWDRWRYRQRIEQYQDNQFYAGHYGYLDSSRRALIYTLRL